MDKQEIKRFSKQNYLRKEILEAGYSGEQFSEFILTRRASGEDVDRWSESELQTLVDDFKRLPKICFSAPKLSSMAHSYSSLAVEVEKLGCFKMKVPGVERPLVRSLEDFVWTVDRLAKEEPVVWTVRPLPPKVLLDQKTNKIKAEFLPQLKVYLEQLFAYLFVAESEPLSKFFRLGEEEFQEFKKAG